MTEQFKEWIKTVPDNQYPHALLRAFVKEVERRRQTLTGESYYAELGRVFAKVVRDFGLDKEQL